MSIFLENQSLRAYNTFGVDVNARYFTSFSKEEELLAALSSLPQGMHAPLILGGGSNILFTKNFDGAVLHNTMKGIEVVEEDEHSFVVKAAAGETWHDLVMYSIDSNMAGLENLSLIPGSVGASPMQNIGAYGVEVKDVFHSLEAIHIHEKAKRIFHSTECSFGYRDSVFKQKEKNKWVITSVSFRLKKHPEFHTGYGAIQDELDKMNLDKMSIRAVSQAVIAIRKSKLPDPKKLGNAGSFFKNPVVPIAVYEAVKEKYSDAPCYPIDSENVKVPAGWLIEKAGWKGKQIGKYGVHDKQALVIVNFGGATGSELFELSTQIIGDVSEKFGIHLEREVNIY